MVGKMRRSRNLTHTTNPASTRTQIQQTFWNSYCVHSQHPHAHRSSSPFHAYSYGVWGASEATYSWRDLHHDPRRNGSPAPSEHRATERGPPGGCAVEDPGAPSKILRWRRQGGRRSSRPCATQATATAGREKERTPLCDLGDSPRAARRRQKYEERKRRETYELR